MPHSEIHGSKGARPSPRLIAACHVLHRLLPPRHPSNALESLDRSSLAFMHGEDCAAIQKISTHTASTRERARRCQSPSCVSTDGACAHGRTLIHDVNDAPTRTARRRTCFSPTSQVFRIGGADRDRTGDLKLAKLALSQLSYGPSLSGPCTKPPHQSLAHGPGNVCTWQTAQPAVVGPGRFELPTPRLSSVCSNQLSYEPLAPPDPGQRP